MTEQPPTEPAAAIVLDTSAIAAFARGSLAVGELLAEIDLEGAVALCPLACLVEAATLVPDGHDWLDILLGHRATRVVAGDPGDWRMIANIQLMVGGYQSACAAWLALETGVDVMTRNPGLYDKLDGGGITLPFDD